MLHHRGAAKQRHAAIGATDVSCEYKGRSGVDPKGHGASLAILVEPYLGLRALPTRRPLARRVKTLPMLRILMLGLALADDGAAPPEAPPPPSELAQGEYNRLHDDLQNLSKRQIWVGAEKTFQEMQALGLPLDFDDYVAGAHAARQLGDMGRAYERLTAAARLRQDREVIDWLFSIDTGYGRVVLVTDPPRPGALEAVALPMLPEQRLCVENAQRLIAESGNFSGLLPIGEYSFGGKPFTVSPGQVPVALTAPPPRGRGLGRE